MNLVASDTYSTEEKNILQNIVKSVFLAKNEDINTFSADRSFFVSKNAAENADFILDVGKFISDDYCWRNTTFKELGYFIFNEYVDPRISHSIYADLTSGLDMQIKTAPAEHIDIATQYDAHAEQALEVQKDAPAHVIVDLKDIAVGTEVDIVNIPSGIYIIEEN